MLIADNLFDAVFAQYLRERADEVLIVSGYASPEMCARVLLEAAGVGNPVRIQLLVGMASRDGVALDTHAGFLNVQVNTPEHAGRATIHYVANGLSVHSKLYIWLRQGRPLGAWTGSANFTQNGFGLNGRADVHWELMVPTDVDRALLHFEEVAQSSINISDPHIEDHVPIIRTRGMPSGATRTRTGRRTDVNSDPVVLPLVALGYSAQTAPGEVHARGGLNWGQRPNRNPNEAYIPVPDAIVHSGFFPPRGVLFRVETDDDHLLLMTAAQGQGKALVTPQDNALLGEYLRRRLGVRLGHPVDTSDLVRNGSRFVAFYRNDDAGDEPRYLMDYSPAYEELGAARYRV